MFVDERPESVELGTAMGPGWGCIMSSPNPKGNPMAVMAEEGKVGHHGRTRRPFRDFAPRLCRSRPQARRCRAQRAQALQDAAWRSEVRSQPHQGLAGGAAGACLGPVPARAWLEFLTPMKAGIPSRGSSTSSVTSSRSSRRRRTGCSSACARCRTSRSATGAVSSTRCRDLAPDPDFEDPVMLQKRPRLRMFTSETSSATPTRLPMPIGRAAPGSP